jgi:hypothetical protein
MEINTTILFSTKKGLIRVPHQPSWYNFAKKLGEKIQNSRNIKNGFLLLFYRSMLMKK